jgi:spore coat polysaccharide biosynthesis protein SpsF (cytidylyltransferase family)
VKNLVILQARMGSCRLPGKVLKKINNRSVIEWQISRIRNSSVEKIIVATSTDDTDDKLAQEVADLGITVFRGSLNDVHSRFVTILKENMPDYFIRLTGDCPLVMPSLLDKMINYFESSNFDYLSNVDPPTFPDGLDIEIISSKSFLEFSKFNLTDEEREHVTLGIRKRPKDFRIGNFVNGRDLSKMRWTVDYEEDFNFVSRIFEYFSGREVEFTIEDILQALDSGKVADNLVPAEYRNITLVNGVEGV